MSTRGAKISNTPRLHHVGKTRVINIVKKPPAVLRAVAYNKRNFQFCAEPPSRRIASPQNDIINTIISISAAFPGRASQKLETFTLLPLKKKRVAR